MGSCAPSARSVSSLNEEQSLEGMQVSDRYAGPRGRPRASMKSSPWRECKASSPRLGRRSSSSLNEEQSLEGMQAVRGVCPPLPALTPQ